MDALKKAHLYSFIAADKVSVSKFIEKWVSNLSDELLLIYCDMNKRNAIELQLSQGVLESLETDLDLNNYVKKLIEQNEKGLDNIFDYYPDVDLKTLEELSHKRLNEVSTYNYNWKYRHEWINKPIQNSSSMNLQEKDDPVAILTVQIFKPAAKEGERCKLNLDREYEVLSYHTLDVLRDSFFCISDFICEKDYSDNPKDDCSKTLTHDKGGFFLIENAFYCDTRHEGLSIQPIIQWTKEKNIGDFEVKSMHETKFSDLTIQLGFPYLYMHKENCEHLITFSDIRLLVPQLDDSGLNYPRCTAIGTSKMIRCQICNINYSKWLVMNNKRLPYTRFYFCRSCFKSFNYDVHGNKIGTFEAFPIMLDYN